MGMDDSNFFGDGFLHSDLIQGIQVAILNCLESAGRVPRDEEGRYWFLDRRQVVDRQGREITNSWYSDEDEGSNEW
jgi:hypothetical protein